MCVNFLIKHSRGDGVLFAAKPRLVDNSIHETNLQLFRELVVLLWDHPVKALRLEPDGCPLASIDARCPQRILRAFVMVLHHNVNALVLASSHQPIGAIEAVRDQCVSGLKLIECLPKQLSVRQIPCRTVLALRISS